MGRLTLIWRCWRLGHDWVVAQRGDWPDGSTTMFECGRPGCGSWRVTAHRLDV